MDRVKGALASLKELDARYFKKFNECYPLYVSEEAERVFGPSELYEMAIEAQVLLTLLGDTAKDRMNYIGFNMLYPFSNPVDWYSWKEKIKDRKVPQSIYFSIGVRMEAEFNRMEQFVERNAWEEYSKLSSSEFSVSCGRYLEHFEDCSQKEEAEDFPDADDRYGSSSIHIETFNYNQAVEKAAVNNLEKWHKNTGIWSNISNVAAKIFGV
ncbi:hypothetical protein HBJ58_18325 [Halomonas desiderata]|uniref:hypothetical protein n=1 Tax=Billgrantia desiderata TaxID=52021 RepID=UPI00174C39D6|nr:hypothetical protein [Halomonas desiderata]